MSPPPGTTQEQRHKDAAKIMPPFPPRPLEDRISQYIKMHPVFCTANIPAEILDEFITKTNAGSFAMGEFDTCSGAPCILETDNLNSIAHGSRKPMPYFQSPFLNKTDDQIRAWMMKDRRLSFAHRTFTILDQDSIQNKTCRIGYISDYCPDNRMVVTDFLNELYIRVPIEEVTLSWFEVCDDSDMTRYVMECLQNVVVDKELSNEKRQELDAFLDQVPMKRASASGIG